MQYDLILTGRFKKSLKLAKKRGLDITLLDDIVTMLQNNIPLFYWGRNTLGLLRTESRLLLSQGAY